MADNLTNLVKKNFKEIEILKPGFNTATFDEIQFSFVNIQNELFLQFLEKLGGNIEKKGTKVFCILHLDQCNEAIKILDKMPTPLTPKLICSTIVHFLNESLPKSTILGEVMYTKPH